MGWSDTGPFLLCPQLWAYKGPLGLDAEPTMPRMRGSLLHIGEAHWYGRRMIEQDGDDPDDYYPPLQAVVELAKRNDQENTWAKVKWLEPVEQVCGVLDRQMTDPFVDRHVAKILGVELELLADLNEHADEHERCEDGSYSQRADLIIEDYDGQVWIVDHKGTGRVTKSTVNAFEMDGQMLGYQWLGRSIWGERFGGVMVGLVEWGKSERFIREGLKPAWDAINKFPTQVLRARRRREELLRTRDLWDFDRVMSSHGACMHRYGPCDFLSICKYGPEANGIRR